MSQFKIVSGSWAALQQEIKPIRDAVFIQEQQIAPEDEWDAEDAVSLHIASACHSVLCRFGFSGAG